MQATSDIAFHDLEPPETEFRRDLVEGLSAPHKRLSCKYFYDQRGSALFERICRLEAYYPTRTELALLARHGPEIAALGGPGAVLVEFGAGSGEKVRRLLRHLNRPAAYIGIDISRRHLAAAARGLAHDHPGLRVVAVCADYTAPVTLPSLPGLGAGLRLGLFFGSTIGNFAPQEAVRFLGVARRALGAGGGLLVGVDLKKERRVLEAAYDDEEGVTAAFNLNLLVRANRELGADFDLDGFAHQARYNARQGRMEMYLVSRRAQTVHVAGHAFRFAPGERIHTENSYKYTLGTFRRMAARAGLRPQRAWVDEGRLFSLHYLEIPA